MAPGARPAPASLTGDEPLLAVRPRFVPALALAACLPLQLFLAVAAGGFFGGLGLIALRALGVEAAGWVPFAACGALFLAGVPAVLVPSRRRAYGRTEARFYAHDLVLDDGAGGEPRAVPYSAVRGVRAAASALQRRHGMGTVWIDAAEAARVGSAAADGLRIPDVEDAEAVCARLVELVERGAQPVRRAA